MNNPIRNRKGFTLIELLTVIAIIGILAAVLFPGVQGVMRAAKKNSALNKIRNIGQGYVSWSQGTRNIASGTWSSGKSQTTSISGYAAILADGAQLDSGELWFLDGDKAADTIDVIPKTVITKSGSTVSIATAFSTALTQGKSGWNVYTKTSRSLAGSVITPLGWSRGLKTDGTWPAEGTGDTDSVWGTEGGHICYGDGHVNWVPNTAADGPNAFQKTDGTASANYTDAIPTGAALCTQN